MSGLPAGEVPPRMSNKLLTRHTKLREMCTKLVSGMKLFDETAKPDYNMHDIIKKIYKVLYQNFDLLEGAEGQSDHKIFKLIDDNNNIITIIPGVDLSLISKSFKEGEQMNKFWGYIYVMFIASIKMSLIANKNSKKMTGEYLSNLKRMIKILQKRVNNYGLSADKKLFNPYFGINVTSDDSTLSIEDMFANVETTNANIVESMISNLDIGKFISKFIDVESINSHLKNIKESEIKGAIDMVSEILNVGDNTNVRNNINYMAGELITDLKKNGISNILETTQNLGKRLNEKVDKKCMQETGGLLKDLLENGEERMQKLINKSDPQTAENIKQNSAMFKQFAKPMKLLKSLLPDMGKLNK